MRNGVSIIPSKGGVLGNGRSKGKHGDDLDEQKHRGEEKVPQAAGDLNRCVVDAADLKEELNTSDDQPKEPCGR